MLLCSGKLDGVGLEHTFLKIFSLRRDVATEIALHDERSDRHTEGGTETGVLDIDGDCNLGVVVGGEAHEGRVVASVGVLSSTGFATDFNVGEIGQTACTAGDSHAHTLGNVIVPMGGDGGDMFFKIFSRNNGVLNLFNNMRCDVVAAVGNRGTQICNLKRGREDFSLTDRY